MAVKVGINGLGRIGRQVLKIMKEKYADDLDIVAFNDIGDLPTMAHLFKYDSTYGKFDGDLEVKSDGIVVNGDHIKALSERDPANLPWGDLGVDIVIESTGFFRKRPDAAKHLSAGAKKVIISAPATDPDMTIVLGVNDDEYDAAAHNIISNASCTTNCLAPPTKVIHDNFTIKRAVMTTIHSYTNDQRILDLPHKDLRRARAAAINMIPTTTGAAKAIGLVIPDLQGKIDGISVRVPTPTGSLVDLVAEIEKDTTTEGLHEALKQAAAGAMKGILSFSEEELVLSDIVGSSYSSVVDAGFTSVYGGTMVKLLAWYDNEWGYSVRTADLTKLIADKL
jgi:glyceraldehyde 3-phosphate dehydrogenase